MAFDAGLDGLRHCVRGHHSRDILYPRDGHAEQDAGAVAHQAPEWPGWTAAVIGNSVVTMSMPAKALVSSHFAKPPTRTWRDATTIRNRGLYDSETTLL